MPTRETTYVALCGCGSSFGSYAGAVGVDRVRRLFGFYCHTCQQSIRLSVRVFGERG